MQQLIRSLVQKDNKAIEHQFHVVQLSTIQVIAAWCKLSLNIKHTTLVIVDRRPTPACH